MSEEFRSELPSIGAENGIAALALTKVGCRYSQDRRYEEGFYDCSSLVQRCCAEAGISFPGTSSGRGTVMVVERWELEVDERICCSRGILFSIRMKIMENF